MSMFGFQLSEAYILLSKANDIVYSSIQRAQQECIEKQEEEGKAKGEKGC